MGQSARVCVSLAVSLFVPRLRPYVAVRQP